MRYKACLAFLAYVAGHSIDSSSSVLARLLTARSLCRREISCILNAEASEGPFYVAAPLIRSSIVEDRAGAKLDLTIEVMDARTCEPIKDIWIDIWHADADGVYSGWASGKSLTPISSLPSSKEDVTNFDFDHFRPDVLRKRGVPVDDTRFLRGVQRTSKKGLVNFETIVPGWYRGRSDHIHVRVHSSNSTVVDGHLLGGTVSHTGQFFFDDSFIRSLKASIAPYNTRELEPKQNLDDFIYKESRGFEQIVKITESSPGRYRGSVVVGIDPSSIQPPSKGPGFGRRPPHGRPPGGPIADGARPGLQNFVLGFFVVLIVLSGIFYWRGQRNIAQEGHVYLPE